ncbi:MAG: hypothetical protein JNM31_02820 [Flavobacteriales bacterium]|nr:hypothetical protein [Flavobacteriales bacterium]
MTKRKKPTKKELLQLERGALREEQKAQGALDGRFRERKMESRKRYARKPKHPKKDG